ncbi:hypothetical protein WOLCODRAFT_138851 [Wolfiporia cocos MD-104 SS10]|uniref:Uncharacterized protein n=1 Tax=Wolfiporia cocos (strain MD-104) TaxID=742152 RepID=A0A2H3K5B5_WOLCO|nr:hypothetical protein WOLCODRAFT_138851 [Wolfiporia cocos MD-104 SS10]
MSNERPVTSKARGVCKYYNTSRGCFAGDRCKFLHGETDKFTPYDKHKTCRYFAAGYCVRGDKCWFRHATPEPIATPEDEEEEDLCCICYEKPVTFGLLGGCSHVFCVGCIRSWRDRNGKSEEVVSSGVIKQCPLCRAPSKFVTPSSKFYPEGHPEKTATIERYKASMARVPCRHFYKSPVGNRHCPFGKDCFYKHLNEDGTPYVFETGIEDTARERRRRDWRFNFRDPPWDVPYFRSALESIRANISGLEDYEDGLDIYSDEDDYAGAHDDGPFAERMAETMERLVNAIQLSDFGWGGGYHVRFRLGTPISLAADGGVEEASASPEPTSEATSDTIIPMPASAPSDQAPEDASDSTRTGVTSESYSRFSTVVRRDSYNTPDLADDTLENNRPLPSSAALFSSANWPSLGAEVGTAPSSSCAANDAQVAHEADVLIGEAEDFDQRVQEVLQFGTLEPDQPSPSTSRPSAEPAHGDAHAAPPDPDRVSEALQDNDPPFLTDGRGRVVWSSTTSGRSREGRRGRAAVSQQQKMYRELSEGDLSAMRSAEESGQRPASRPRQLQRAHTDPEGELRSAEGL